MSQSIASIATAADDDNYIVDASGFKGWAETVFLPPDESAVVDILRRAGEERVPITVIGARSGLTGGGIAQGGWVISTEAFRDIQIDQGRARVGAAVTLLDLRDAAAPSRQFYAPDPTEITASIGGTIATNASGSRSFLYGSTRRHVSAIRVALMDGSVREYRRGDKIDFRVPHIPWPNTRKCTAGYPLAPEMDYIDLFCGSEGTLGIVLEAELTLLPVPEELFSAVIFFRSDEAALDAVDAWRPIPGLRMLEYVDRNSLDLIYSRYPEIPSDASAALLLEAEGQVNHDDWADRLATAQALTDESWFAVSPSDRERFRKLRHSLPEMVNATVIRQGFMKMGTDYAVPITRNREMLRNYRQRLETELPGRYVIYGHIGDAHAHVNMLPSSEREAAVATALLKEFAIRAVQLGGTVSAEHGLGKRKAYLLELQYAPQHIEAMMQVKRRFDPNWLLGRETLFPVPSEFS